MTATTHTHRAVPASHRIFGWTHCVATGGCSGAAHGGIVAIDTCRCGATRQTESNGRHQASSGWTLAEAETAAAE